MNTLQRIVVFRSDFSNQEKQLALLREHGAQIIRVLRIINGVAVQLAADKEALLNRAPEIVRIDTDEHIVEAL